MDGLPSLGALRIFEVAARLGSFQKAAEELNLTPSAISYQIRVLEDSLGQPLFLRQHRKVSLTPVGLTFQHYVQRGFAELRAGTSAVKLVRNPNVLRVTSAPAFANAFITTGLRQFERDNPRIEVQLVIAHSVLDLVADGLDVAIRFSVDPPHDLFARRLASLTYRPTCIPEMAADLRDPADLLRRQRIAVREHPMGWRDWFAAADIADQGERELEVETMNVAIQSTIDGMGIGLLPSVIVARQIAQGRLVTPFRTELASRYSYWFCCRRGDEDALKIRKFRAWLEKELVATIG